MEISSSVLAGSGAVKEEEFTKEESIETNAKRVMTFYS